MGLSLLFIIIEKMGHVRSNERTWNNNNNNNNNETSSIANIWGADSLLSHNSAQEQHIQYGNNRSEHHSNIWNSGGNNNNHSNNNNNNNGGARLTHQMNRQLEDVWGRIG